MILTKELAEIIVSTQIGSRVEVISVNQYYTAHLMYQVDYLIKGEDKVLHTTISETDILNLKRC
jgi:hypothetical protein